MNDYFCVLPFYGKEYIHGKQIHCCLLPSGYVIDEIKKQDSWKKIHIKDYLPEFYNLISRYYTNE